MAPTQHSPAINLVTYNMLSRLGHHLVPAVPVPRFGVLAKRLAATAQDFAANERLGVPEVRR